MAATFATVITCLLAGGSLLGNLAWLADSLKKQNTQNEAEHGVLRDGVARQLSLDVATAIDHRRQSAIWMAFDNLTEHVAALQLVLPELRERVRQAETGCACQVSSDCARLRSTPAHQILGYSAGVLDLARGNEIERCHWEENVAPRLTTVVSGAYSENWSLDRLCDAHSAGIRFVLGNPQGADNLPQCQRDCGCSEWCEACNKEPYWNCFFNVSNVASIVQAWVVEVAERYADGFVFDIESHANDYSPFVGSGTPFSDAYGLFAATYTAMAALAAATVRAVLPGAIVGAAVAWAPTGVDDRFYDYAGLAAGLDFLFIMDYCVRSQVYDRCIAHGNGYMDVVHGWQQYIAMGIKPEKLVAGVNWAGQSWQCYPDDPDNVDVCRIDLSQVQSTFRGVNCSDAAASEIDFKDALNLLRHGDPDRRLVADRRFDAYTKLPFFNWRSNTNETLHQTWYDDIESLGYKYAAARDVGLAGVGAWTFGKLNYSTDDPLIYNDTASMWAALDTFSDAPPTLLTVGTL